MRGMPDTTKGPALRPGGSQYGRSGATRSSCPSGTGSATDKTNDVLVTTTEQAKVGDVITAKGVVRVDKDFGAGYTYKAMVEDASLQK